MLESLRRIRNALPSPGPGRQVSDRLELAGVKFKSGETIGDSCEDDPRDTERILRNVRQAKQFSDFCIVSNHEQDPGNWSQEPADYAQSFVHKLIDAGADAYVAHGRDLLVSEAEQECRKARPKVAKAGPPVTEQSV